MRNACPVFPCRGMDVGHHVALAAATCALVSNVRYGWPSAAAAALVFDVRIPIIPTWIQAALEITNVVIGTAALVRPSPVIKNQQLKHNGHSFTRELLRLTIHFYNEAMAYC